MSNFKKVSSSLKSPSTCPGINWRGNRSDGNYDKEIIKLLKLLNKLSYCHTTGSCAGHSLKEIEKGKKGWLVEIPYRISISLHIEINSIDKFISLIKEMEEISNPLFWCELGYRDSYNHQTEIGFIAFEIVVFAHTKQTRDNLLKEFEKIVSNHI